MGFYSNLTDAFVGVIRVQSANLASLAPYLMKSPYLRYRVQLTGIPTAASTWGFVAARVEINPYASGTMTVSQVFASGTANLSGPVLTPGLNTLKLPTVIAPINQPVEVTGIVANPFFTKVVPATAYINVHMVSSGTSYAGAGTVTFTALQ